MIQSDLAQSYINMNNLKLEEYPKAILENELKLVDLKEKIKREEKELARLDFEIEKEVAFLDTLKNENQRKNYRQELQQSKNYQQILMNLGALDAAKSLVEIDLRFLQNQFSVVKLQARLRIAEMTMTVEG